MNQKKKQSFKKGLKVTGIIVGIIVGLNVIGFATNKLFYSHELDTIKPYGSLVSVNDQKMHIYSLGNGEHTIVLLPGFGIALPSADFGPLIRELSKDYTVVCIDYFGMGFSDQTTSPRINQNYVEEIRSALSKSGFNPPYILMPHSASGIYSEYYAAKYPKEVSAIIMMDTTSTVKITAKNPPKILYSLGKVQQATGFTKLALSLVKLPQNESNGYTKKENNDLKLFMGHILNDTIIDQSFRMLDNVNEASGTVFPTEIPVLKLISSQSLKRVGEPYQANHLKRLGPNAVSKVLEGTHFIYQTRVKEIASETRTFLEKIK